MQNNCRKTLSVFIVLTMIISMIIPVFAEYDGTKHKTVLDAVYDDSKETVIDLVYKNTLEMLSISNEELKIIDQYPKNNGENVDINKEFYLLFNKPVEIVDNLENMFIPLLKNYINVNYGLDSNNLEKQKLFSEHTVLEVSKDNPCKVIINIDEILSANNYYKIFINGLAIKSRDQDEFWKDKNKWWSVLSDPECQIYFNTNNGEVVPNIITINNKMTKRIQKDKKLQLDAIVKDIEGNIIKDCKLKWISNNLNRVKINENGLLSAKSPGYVTVTAQVYNMPNIKDTYQIEVRENFNQQLINKWSAKLERKDYIGHPVVESDNSVYAIVCDAKWTIENGYYCIVAYNQDGTKKETFKSSIIDPVQIAINEIEGQTYIFAIKDHKKIVMIDTQTGQIVRERKLDIDGKIITTPVVNKEGKIFVGATNGRIYAVDGGSQEDRYFWSFDAEGSVFAGYEGYYGNNKLTLDHHGRVYAVSHYTLWAIDQATGNLLWKFVNPEHEKFTCQPAVASDGRVYIHDEQTVYALSNKGNEIWHKDFINISNASPLVDVDENIYLNSDSFVKLDRENGQLLEEYPYITSYYRLGKDGYLYTDKAIYNENREPIAYYDEYKNNLPWFHYSSFDLGEDGNIYRLIINEGNVIGIEAVYLHDISNAIPKEVKIYEEDKVVIFPDEKYRVKVDVLDEKGANLPTIGLVWEIDNENIVKIDDTGLITAKTIGETMLTVRVKDKPEINKTVKIEVINPPTPKKMYFVYDKGDGDNETENQRLVGEKLTGIVGEGFEGIRVFIEDEKGKFVPKQPIKWSLEDNNIVDMLNYQGGSGDYNIRYNACLTGKKVGSTKLIATIEKYPEITCSLEIEVIPTQYEIKWSIPLEGYWWEKRAYHVMGKNNEIFYVNQNKLIAIDKRNGNRLWQSEIGDYFGIQLGKPKVNDEGTILLYAEDFTAIIAVNPKTGEVMWNFIEGKDGIKDIKIHADSIYALTKSGKIYKFNKEGELLWDIPLNIGQDNGGMILSNNGELYVSMDGTIYHVKDNKEKEAIYSRKRCRLYLEEVILGEKLVLQKEENEKYSLITIDFNGNEQWIYEDIKEKVALSCDEAGAVYAIEKKYIMDPQEGIPVYFINPDGTERARQTINVATGKRAIFKPVIGKDGLVYISLSEVFVLDPDDGEILWKAQMKDAFSRQTPDSITVDEESIVYITAGERGLVALKGKVQNRTGFQLNVLGKHRLKPNSLKDLKIEVRNNEMETKNIAVIIGFYDEKEQLIHQTNFKDVLKTKETKIYMYGSRIPVKGQFKLKIILKDQKTKETLCNDEIDIK
ncbi:PQQ-binding-like beta-propeller repeat protein [Crassaminicella indica]|uniref:PQQ-binding-like beta-propeller repeat protein n=1 Tax=Crassaminicella indica TaxID=2855394 RepID=A0ABX8R8A9_9CLOT|nr:PQQ-binding-like beta-propeller repeat protein [Crassaminicella indica]QXM05253.1 PQQ-binding-like beta-propeller repeat protein [Crassaminicella indica]